MHGTRPADCVTDGEDEDVAQADTGGGRDWRPIFGHDEPYDDQVDGIEAAVDTAAAGGYLALEGACGTGKTHIALTAGIHLVRDPDTDYERVFVLTSVKQQLRQFEADLRIVNENLPVDWRPISGLTLVGKADVCPYNREGTGGINDENVYNRCDNLRERTRDITDEIEPGSLASRARSQQVDLVDSGTGSADTNHLESAGAASPYPRKMPEFGREAEATETEFCPFYAQYLDALPDDGDPVEAVPFDHSRLGLVNPEELVARAIAHGTCPHSIMGALLPHVEVIIGNYYHAFEPTTVESFTGALLDDTTFVVFDEAHMLEPRVRDLVSDGVADASLRDAEHELAQVIQPVTLGDDQSVASAALVEEELADSTVSLSDLQAVRAFIRDLRKELDSQVRRYLNGDRQGWRADLTDLEDAEIPLRDPAEPGIDELTEWAEREDHADEWTRAEPVGTVVARILNAAVDEDKRRAAPGVGRTLAAWARADHATYFREIELERIWDDTEPTDSWRRAYNARLGLYNCVPGDAIADRLRAFGGGVLMSATLAPLDVLAEVTGLANLADERPVVERTYGLDFPEENRASFAVAAPKFTYTNRGPPATGDAAGGADAVPGEENEVRRAYADAICDVAAGPGNILVGMPSYAEAEWAAAVLRKADVGKPVLVDETSADDVTQQLKESFFAGPGKVLVTSLRGTLTEGVDYRGDRLRSAVVCGVPIVNTASPRTSAVQAAYDRRFGDTPEEHSGSQPNASASGKGFEYALAVPAVQKARQAVGRVIRGPEEVGVRVLLDKRYARDSWDSVRPFLGPDRKEFRTVSPNMLGLGVERFWDHAE